MHAYLSLILLLLPSSTLSNPLITRQTTAPPGSYLGIISWTGTGCPDPDSLDTAPTASGSIVVTPGIDRAISTTSPTSCQVSFEIYHPPGSQFAIEFVGLKGRVSLAEGEEATEKTDWWITGTERVSSGGEKVWTGPLAGEYSRYTVGGKTGEVWSDCQGGIKHLVVKRDVSATGNGWIEGKNTEVKLKWGTSEC